ncbi:MAG: hypothetical protein Q8P56_05980 [Candidatus Uhrbacteria bacterium]|nr:hypothetical protein [Candidatus Uhrbacteria bacterium]
MSKESFLRKTTEAAIVAGTMAATGASFPEKGQNVDINALYAQTSRDAYHLLQETFDYSVYSEANAKKVDILIHALDDFEREYNAAYGIAAGVDPMKTTAEQRQHIPTRETLIHLRMKLWTSLQNVFPDLPSYTEQQFYKTIVSLPGRFAPLGISVAVGVYSSELGGVPYDIFVKFSGFFPVVKKERLSRNYFGHSFNAYGMKIGSRIGEGEKEELNKDTSAFTLFGNFFEPSHRVTPTVGAWQNAHRYSPDLVKRYEARFGSIPAQQPYRNDYVVNSAIVDLVSHSPQPTDEDTLDSVHAHELGHVLDHQDSDYQKNFVFTENDPGRLPVYRLHADSHNELDGILTDLRYGDDSASMFMFLSSLVSDHEKGAPTHHYGARWIYAQLVPIIASDPKKYGITLDGASRYSTDEQILIALPRIMREQPKHLDVVWEELWHLHRTRLTEPLYMNSLSAASTPDQMPPSEQKKASNLPLTQILIGGVGVFATLLAAFQAKKYREKVQKEQALLQGKIASVRGVIVGLENGTALFDDLQIGTKEKNVDAVRREKAYMQIADIARKSNKVKRIYQTIKELIGRE